MPLDDIFEQSLVSLISFIFKLFWIIVIASNYFPEEGLYFSPYFIIHENEFSRLFTCLKITGSSSSASLATILVLFQLMRSLEKRFFSKSTFTFLALNIYSYIGVLITGFLEPEPFLLDRILLFYLYLNSKMFSEEDIKYNKIFGKKIELSYAPIAHIIYSFIFCRESRNVTKLFIFLWAHLYYFIMYIGPNCGLSKNILRFPKIDKIIENALLFLLV